MTQRKRYLTPIAKEYVILTKLKLARIMEEKGFNIETLSFASGVPQSTLSRWLDPDKPDFMGLADSVVVCEALGITVREMLADPTWREFDVEDERYLYIRPLMKIPISHIKALTDFYWRFRELFAKES